MKITIVLLLSLMIILVPTVSITKVFQAHAISNQQHDNNNDTLAQGKCMIIATTTILLILAVASFILYHQKIREWTLVRLNPSAYATIASPHKVVTVASSILVYHDGTTASVTPVTTSSVTPEVVMRESSRDVKKIVLYFEDHPHFFFFVLEPFPLVFAAILIYYQSISTYKYMWAVLQVCYI